METGCGTGSRAPRRPRDRRNALVVGQTVLLTALAVAVGHPFTDQGPAAAHAGMPWWLLAVAFAATEACVFHLHVGRQARTVSVSELPLVLGLFLASPLALLAGRLVGSGVVCLVQRRSSVLKTSWNLAMIGLQTAVAVAVFSLVAGGHDGTSPLAWLGAHVAAAAANCVGSIALSCVIAVHEHDFGVRAVVRDAVLGDPVAPVAVTLGLVAVTSLAASPHSAWLLAVTLTGLLLGYRTHARLADRHLDLERILRFTQSVTSWPELDEVLGSVLAEAKELLRSDRAEVAFVVSSQDDVARVRLGASNRLTRSEEPRSPEDEWLLDRVVRAGRPVLLPRGTRDPEHRRFLSAQGARDVIAVPLRGGTGVLGVLLVADRLGDVRTYDRDDVLLVETVADHAARALQNGELIDRLRHEAMHDTLTGLPNRALLQRRLSASLDDVHGGRSAGAAVMILDLDGFKAVNDTLGHLQGDRLLIEVGGRLTTAVGSSGLVARLGGDEFAVLVPHTDDTEHVVRIARRVLASLEQPVALDEMTVEVGGSLGVALAPLHADEPAELLKRADLAMYDAKSAGGGLRLYEAELDTRDPRRLALVTELRTALEDGSLGIHVMPQALLPSGEVVGVEALVRWTSPELGVVEPDELLPLAERSGLIRPLTAHVLDRSLAAVAGWRARGIDLGIAVNLSARSLQDADLVEEVRRALHRHAVPGSRLTLEVTESAVMADPASAAALLHRLRELGCRLSVDDFGTGCSSLPHLTRLPVHEVKVDRGLLTGLHAGEDALPVVRTIVDLGRILGLDVVAEGVADRATWDLLAAVGCDRAQGWVLARPMPVDSLPAWLADRTGRGAQPSERAWRTMTSVISSRNRRTTASSSSE